MFSAIEEWHEKICRGTFDCNGAEDKEVNRGVFRTLSDI